MAREITVAGDTYGLEEAKDTIAGYAFGTRREKRQKISGYVPLEPTSIDIPWFGYLTYDCIGVSGSENIGACTDADLLVSSGLNGRLDVDALGALQAVAPLAIAELANIPDEDGFYFWQLDPDGLISLPPDGPERHLHHAWVHMMSARDVGVALTHKVLHHKRPRLFPLIDGRTVEVLGRTEAWKTIHQDLVEGASAFEELEGWFSNLMRNVSLAWDRDDLVSLSRLRLHDTLLWCRASGRIELATREGRQVRESWDQA